VKRQELKNRIKKKSWLFAFVFLPIVFSCNQEIKLKPVSYSQFEEFVNSTGYVTDAEKYGWSIVQINVYDFNTVDNANWRKPDGVNAPLSKDLPVTQVSYNDAIAYCRWAGKRLPSYEEYWELIKNDSRTVVFNTTLPLSDVNSVNVLGNVWDITGPANGNSVRLAGGSLFCSITTCNGTDKDRELFVDKETGNINIGFSVMN
jgi:hypothetical protein